MTPEAQRIAIAEFCGLKFPYGIQFNDKGAAFDMHGSHAHCPDYLNDLNAMHEAWRKMSDDQKFLWRTEITKIVERDRFLGRTEDCWYEGATAAQRAEALLRTIGKWQTEKEPTK
jgi:hypothetical protein